MYTEWQKKFNLLMIKIFPAVISTDADHETDGDCKKYDIKINHWLTKKSKETNIS